MLGSVLCSPGIIRVNLAPKNAEFKITRQAMQKPRYGPYAAGIQIWTHSCVHSLNHLQSARCYSRYCLEPPLTKMPCAISDPLAHGPHGSSRSKSMMIRPPSHIASYQTNHLTSRAILFIIHCDASQASYSFNIVTKVKICSEQPSPVGETHQCPQVSCHLHVRKL